MIKGVSDAYVAARVLYDSIENVLTTIFCVDVLLDAPAEVLVLLYLPAMMTIRSRRHRQVRCLVIELIV